MDKGLSVSSRIIKASQEGQYFGKVNDPSGAAHIKGLCGDEIEFYLVIENNIITEIKYYTQGCVFTKACGQIAARFAFNKSI